MFTFGPALQAHAVARPEVAPPPALILGGRAPKPSASGSAGAEVVRFLSTHPGTIESLQQPLAKITARPRTQGRKIQGVNPNFTRQLRRHARQSANGLAVRP